MRTRPNIPDDELPSGDFQPLPNGDYDFTIKQAEDKRSSSGNDMIEMQLTVWDNDGRERTIFDYLVDSDASEWKVRSFADATGLREAYDTGNLQASDCVGASGRVTLRIQAARVVNGKSYDARNTVKAYVAAKVKPRHEPEPAGMARDLSKRSPVLAPPIDTSLDDSSIPF